MTLTPHHSNNAVTIRHGDCLDVLRDLDDGSIDAIVTDPPYEQGFMGQAWDASGIAYSVDLWSEALRVLKPGGHLLAFGGTRTVHRMTVAIEDAGFEIRDGIDWLYGSGFPKSLDVSKAIDKAAGAEREPGVPGPYASRRPRDEVSAVSAYHDGVGDAASALITAPATDDARRWAGWGTALKPAREPIVVARKRLAGTVAANVLAHSTGAINIDACRVEVTDESYAKNASGDRGHADNRQRDMRFKMTAGSAHTLGRWPSNVVLSHAAAPNGGDACAEGCAEGCAVAELDAQSGASRFFPVFRYQAKAPIRERPKVGGVAHPTVKPLALMRWLVRLVTPPGGVVLDPFGGSGTTAEACVAEGFACVVVEREANYLPLINARLSRSVVPAAHAA